MLQERLLAMQSLRYLLGPLGRGPSSSSPLWRRPPIPPILRRPRPQQQQRRPFSPTTPRRSFDPNKWHRPEDDPYYKLSRARPLVTAPRLRRFARSPTTRGVAAAAVAAAVAFYFANLQTVPVSGRRRFNCVGEEFVAAVAEQQVRRLVWEVERQGGRFLGDRDPRTRLVKRVMARLIPCSGMEDADWEVRVIDDPGTCYDMRTLPSPGGVMTARGGRS